MTDTAKESKDYGRASVARPSSEGPRVAVRPFLSVNGDTYALQPFMAHASDDELFLLRRVATREADAEPNATTTRDPKPNPPDTATELLDELVEAIDGLDLSFVEDSANRDYFRFHGNLAAARNYLSEAGV